MCIAELLKCLAEVCGEGESASGCLGVAALSDCDGALVNFCVTFDRDSGIDACPSQMADALRTQKSCGEKKERTA